MNLTTGHTITRRKVTPVPMTQQVIDTIESMAKTQGMKGLRLRTKTGEVLYDSSWLAGVDYEQSEQDENDEDQESESDEEEEEMEIEQQNEEIDPNDAAEILAEETNPATQEDYNIDKEEEQGDSTQDDSTQDDSNETQLNEEESAEDDESFPHDTITDSQEQPTRRSTRQSVPPKDYTPSFIGKSYMQASTKPDIEYDQNEAKVIAIIMCQFNERMQIEKVQNGNQFVVTYSLKKGIAKFGDQGWNSALKEMKQLHDRKCFKPVRRDELSSIERTRALESLIFLTEKKDGTVKARHCANGSTQRDYMSREDVSSPTVSTESTLLTAVIDAEERRDVATCDIPNAFIQTEVEERDEDGHRTIMKIRGILVDILCEMDPSYNEYIVYEKEQKVLYVHITRAIYGLLVSAMLFYKKFVRDIMKYGFEINPYDPCVANKLVNKRQMTVSWHVDDVKVSHVEHEVVTGFLEWTKITYGSIGEVKITRGKIHDYLGMKLDYSVPGRVTIDMVDYIELMVSGFPKEWLEGPKVASPWNDNLFRVDQTSPKLTKEEAEVFHTVTAQGLFACKRARPDIAPAIAYLTTRVREPNRDDWSKLVRMMKFLQQTSQDKLTLESDGSKTVRWHVDAAFAVHPDFKSHTGGIMSMGKGAITSISRKQGMNTRSSTEAELVAADDIVGPMLWTRRFLEAQGYQLEDNILYQDNQSAILLESNGRRSAGKRSRHLNIRLFFVTDQKEKGHISIKFCPTDQMTGDYMTKPLHGKKFQTFRQAIMNLPMPAQLFMSAFAFTAK